MSKEDKRTPNFTPREKDCLVNIIASYAYILEDKKTNRVNMEEKNKVWKKIEQKFNTEGPMLCYRSANQLKRFYENRKKDLRKKLAENKKEIFLTGGGPPPDLKLDPIDELLVQIVNEKSVRGFDVLFDSDSEPILKKRKENESANQLDDEEEFEFVPDEISEQNEQIEALQFENKFTSDGNKYSRKCPPQYLQTPLSKELDFTSSQNTPNNSGSQGHNSTPRLNKIRQTMQSNRRRPQAHVRALTSSDVSEKYNILLDRRLVLIEKQIEQATECQNFSREEQRKKMENLRQQGEILSLEKEQKILQLELLKLQVANQKSNL